MAPSSKPTASKPRKSIKTTPGQVTQLTRALDDLEGHFGAVLAAWPELTLVQQRKIEEHSPILARLKTLTAPLRG